MVWSARELKVAKMLRRRFVQFAAASATVAPRIAAAETYPARAVRVIVPFAQVGQTDVIARLLSQKPSEHLGQQFYVENKPGAGGNVGTGLTAQAMPDGHTLLFTDGTSFVANPNLYEKVPYTPIAFGSPASTVSQIQGGKLRALAVASRRRLAALPDVPSMSEAG